jgi:hypothetical protein
MTSNLFILPSQTHDLKYLDFRPFVRIGRERGMVLLMRMEPRDVVRPEVKFTPPDMIRQIHENPCAYRGNDR